MPTACEPWPGKTNANEVIGTSPSTRSETPPAQAAASEVEQDGAPGEAAADALEHQRLATADLAAAHSVVERQRDRRSRGVAMLIDRHDNSFRRQLQLLRRALHDAN